MPKTAERLKYEASQRNQATMRQVETLLEQESVKVLDVASGFDRQTMGGYLRSVVPGLIDRWGNVNAVAAMKYYDEQRLAWYENRSVSPSRQYRKNQARQAQRFAAAKLQSEIYVAGLPKFEPVALADPIVGYGMARFTEEGFGALRDQVTSAMTRAVASYNRDTLLYNAGLDSAVVSVQRVAEPGACSFCAVAAFSSWRSTGARVASYAIDFHDRCRCSIETLYEGDSPIRPDYYDDLERDYTNATKVAGTRNAKDVFAEMRKQSGRR